MLNLAVGIMMFATSVMPTQATSTDISLAPVSTSTPQTVTVPKVASELKETTEEIVRDHFADLPIMVEIAKCESRFTQYEKDGSVHRGVINPADVGIFQINESYHLDTSEKLGVDIHTLEGNMAYALRLFKKEGTKPWGASKKCWGKYTEVAKK